MDENIIDQIKQSQILSNYEKALALLAICEKRNTIKLAKQLISQIDINDEAQKKEIKKIMDRMKSKRKGIFDLGKYDKLLGWKYDDNSETENTGRKPETRTRNLDYIKVKPTTANTSSYGETRRNEAVIDEYSEEYDY